MDLFAIIYCSLFCYSLLYSRKLFIFPNERKRGKLILSSKISVTGESTVQALVEIILENIEYLELLKRK